MKERKHDENNKECHLNSQCSRRHYNDCPCTCPIETPAPEAVSAPTVEEDKKFKEEGSNHEQKIGAFVKETSELVLRLEALVYYYSPLRADDRGAQEKMASVLKIDVERLLALRRLMIDGDLAAVTGDVVWLKQPGIARTLLDRFVGDGTFDLTELL